ncbi:MAG TPA: NADH-quinone oxidoreductase subunit E, partial [Hyphomicrobiales bacterium]|nr:NADH-quinone oxidoreductase subunit E [Hyphomicrobiales bacterium]
EDGPDDLKKISGIGPKLEETLHDLGVFHYDQIAEWTPENVAWFDEHLDFKGRIERENWIEQARKLAAGGENDSGGRTGNEK